MEGDTTSNSTNDLRVDAMCIDQITGSSMTNEEMVALDQQAKVLVQHASNLLEAGDDAGAVAYTDQAIEIMQRVSQEINTRREWIMRKCEELKAKNLKQSSG